MQYPYMVTSSHMQIKKSYVNDDMQDHESLTLYAIAPLWTKRLEEANYFLYYLLDDCNCILNLKTPQNV